jgi:hypothetical protein
MAEPIDRGLYPYVASQASQKKQKGIFGKIGSKIKASMNNNKDECTDTINKCLMRYITFD